MEVGNEFQSSHSISILSNRDIWGSQYLRHNIIVLALRAIGAVRKQPTRRHPMKFYDCAIAPSPRRVRVFLAEKGVTVQTIQVDLRKGEQFGEAFRAVNPDCTVPVLELDDGRKLTDSVAICVYLERTNPEPPLMG